MTNASRSPAARKPRSKPAGTKGVAAKAVAAKPPAAQVPRKAVVTFALVAVSVLTIGLLKLLAPQPLVPSAVGSLMGIETVESQDRLFDTPAPFAGDRWQYIYVRHSLTTSGDVTQLAGDTGGLDDHFVIGNGQGLSDGEIVIGHRWAQQQPAVAPIGVSFVTQDAPKIISICLVGDFDRSRPTRLQERRLLELVGALQSRLRIPGENVLLFSDLPASPAGVGRYFEVAELRSQLLP